MERKKVIAVDFDGTLCTAGAYPEIGEPLENVIAYVKDKKANGWELILWTCRDGEPLQNAIKWSKEQGIEFDAINSKTDNQNFNGPSSCKVYADIYLDDRALNVKHIEILKDLATVK